MSEQTELPPDFPGFSDLSELRAAHARLVQRPQEEADSDDFLKDVEGFVIRAQATGRILGDDDDRTSAQNIIDYWVTVLLRGRRTPPETGLAEFGFHTAAGSLRNRPVKEYMAEQRAAIRRRLGLGAAAAQWQDSGRDRALLWGGRELQGAAEYEDLSILEQAFIAASKSHERLIKIICGVAIAAAVLAAGIILALIIAGLVVRNREAVANSQRMQHQVAKTLVERAAVLMRDGDVSGALLWLAQALVEDREAQQDEQIHRIRVGAATAQLARLRHAFIEENPMYLCTMAKFSPDGSLVITVSNPQGAGEGVARLWDATTGKKLADFPESGGRINDAGFSGDGRIVTASGDGGGRFGRVRMWTRDGAQSTDFATADRPVLSATVSPDGGRVALLFEGSEDSPAILDVRRTSDGASLTGPLEWPGGIRDVKFSPDGAFIAAGGRVAATDPGNQQNSKGEVKVWNAWTGKPSSWGEMKPDMPVNCIAFSPDSARLAAGSGEGGGPRGAVDVWNTFTGPKLYTRERSRAAEQIFRQEHRGMVSSVSFSPDGRRVLSSSHDESARVWDARTGAPMLEFKHESSVYHAAYSPDGRAIVSAGRDHTARIWKVATGKVAVPPLGHGLTVFNAEFSPDGNRVLTATTDGARIWEMRTGEPLAPILKLDDPIWKMAVSSDGNLAVAVGRAGRIRTWNTKRDIEEQADPSSEQTLPAIVDADDMFFSKDAELALVVRGSTAQVWKTRSAPQAAPPAMDNGAPIRFAAFSPDGRRVLLASGDRGSTKSTARIWDVESGKPAGQPLAPTGAISYAVFSEDGRHVLTAGGTRSPAYGEARVWDAQSGAPVTPPLWHHEEVTHASFSPDMKHAVTASVDDTAKIWRLDLAAKNQSERALEWRPLTEHSADLTRASFSPDGRMIVTASYDRTAVIWSVETGERISVLQHPGWINDISFSPDGRFVATACADQTVRVWETATGDWISQFRHDGEVTRALFDRDSRHVVTLSAYEPARTLRDAQRSVPPLGVGSAEPENAQASQRTMLKVQRWRLPQLTEPVSNLYDFAQVIRSRQIAKKRDLTRLPRAELARLWNERADIINEMNADSAPASTRYAAQESEATGEWFAARWHLNRLIDASPSDSALRVRRGIASGNLLQWPQAVEDFQAAAAQDPSRRNLLRLARAEIETSNFEQAAAHATSGIEKAPAASQTEDEKGVERDLRMLRAEAYCALQRWDDAAADLLRAIELKPRLPSTYERLATVRLKQGREAEYRELCAQMLKLFGDDDGLSSTAVWASVLREGAVSDPALLVDLAGRTAADQPGRYYHLNTLGAALYRAGRYQEAIQKLNESRAAYVQAASQAQTRSEMDAALLPVQDGRPVDWLFLAMAQWKIGRRTEAEAWLNRSSDAMTSRSIADPRRTWHRLEVEILLDEAKGKIRPGQPSR